MIPLLQHKAETSARGLGKETLSHTAVSCNNTEVAEVLLNCNADTKANNKKKQALLHIAAKYNKKVTILLFLKP